MDTEWMGKYHDLVHSLIAQTNIIAKKTPEKIYINSNDSISIFSLQILEYLIENEDSGEKMIVIANRLGIKQSTFSKAVSNLTKLKLAEKYMFANNRKDIILKPTEEGKELYNRIVEDKISSLFQPFFKELEDVDAETLGKIVKAINALNAALNADSPPAKENLIKIE